jgi:GalNAc-alpha-(1->4)-GalNAc-alpha-(1->3)-diNAcBac-PP-undecaprenol alpha-1,4-N-acetyl-D-galactosaminyltransferase
MNDNINHTDILFFVSSLNTGGAERVATTLCNEWVEKNYRVTLVLTFPGAPKSAFQLDNRVELILLSHDILPIGIKRLLNRFIRTWRIRVIAWRRRPRVIVSFLTNVNVATIIATVGLKIRTLVAERTYPPMAESPWSLNMLRRITYPHASAVLVQTPEALTWLSDQIPAAKGIILPNPVSIPLPNIEPTVPVSIVPAEKHILLSVGRLTPSKDMDRVVRCFAAIRSQFPKWHLAVAGDGPEQQKLEATIEQLGLKDDVTLLGRIGNCADWYERSSAFVTASKYEGFPNALLEALAYGLPALSLDCLAGPRHLISHGVNGLLVDSAALDEEFCDVMAELLLRFEELRPTATTKKSQYDAAEVAREWLKVMGLDYHEK